MTVSRAEEITSEVRKLVQANRYLQGQLAQSITKKDHEAIVAKMQGTTDTLREDLQRTRDELERRGTIESTLNEFTAAFSARLDALEAQFRQGQSEVVEKVTQSTVPHSVYMQAVSQVKEFQDAIREMVPQEEFHRVKDEARRMLESTVSREKYEAATSRIKELEAALANSVPRTAVDELTAGLLSLTRDDAQGKEEAEITEVQPGPTPEVEQPEAEQQAEAPEITAE